MGFVVAFFAGLLFLQRKLARAVITRLHHHRDLHSTLFIMFALCGPLYLQQALAIRFATSSLPNLATARSLTS